MRVLVTGGTGSVGREAVRRLIDHDHDVTVIGRTPDIEIEGGTYRQCDIVDFDCLTDCVQGMDAVVHLAAIPNPGMGTGQAIFHVNCTGTFNVYRAAADAGIRRIVSASSINALGYNFGIKFPEGQLRYFPIDEAHPRYTTDPYSFSKAMIESVGRYMWRREGLTSLFLRFPAVYDLDAGEDAILMRFVARCRRQTAEVLAMDAPARCARVREIVARFEAKARAREWEEGFDLSFPDAYVMFGRSNFWTSLDVRDAARAIEMGLREDYAGSHAVYVTDTHNFVGLPSRQLAGVFFPEVTTWKAPVTGTEALVSTDRVRALIGFEPQYPFETYGLDGS